MPWNPFSQYNNKTNADLYTEGGYEKKKLIAAVFFVSILFMGFVVLAVVIQTKRDRYTRAATAAARKETPNAKAKNVKVAGGFAMATVSDSTAESQIRSGNTTIFRVNEDGSMTQIASGSSFSTLDLLELGIPLATQAELTETETNKVKQRLASDCGYNGGDAPGYSGFGGSFNPNGWQIDAGTSYNLERVLTAVVSDKNTNAKPDDKIICLNVTKKNSNVTTDMKTYISTFTLELQFITSEGAITTHPFTFSIGPKYYRNYTLDGKEIQNT